MAGSLSAKDRISQILSNKLGKGQTFKVAVKYDEKLDPLAALPTPPLSHYLAIAAAVAQVAERCRLRVTYPRLTQR